MNSFSALPDPFSNTNSALVAAWKLRRAESSIKVKTWHDVDSGKGSDRDSKDSLSRCKSSVIPFKPCKTES